MHHNVPMYLACLIGGLLSSMNNWVVDWRHIRLSLNDLYMSILMTGWMFLLLSMYYLDSTQFWIGIISVVISLISIRTQFLINDRQFINGMIPHHSMAVLMSDKIKEKTENPLIYQFASFISNGQLKEINWMTDKINF